MCGICLGHQLLCRAVGLETYKLPFGHRGANHPVKDLDDRPHRDHQPEPRLRRRSGPTASSTIDDDEPVRWDTDFGAAELTHVNLYDRTVEGLVLRDVHGATVQYHPEAGPGPHDALYLFDRFLRCAVRAAARRHPARSCILGSGPIVIGQAAEFDYSGTQACKVLREEGYEVVLVNSNPATIMTDPEFADATYVEPLLPGPGGAGHRARAPRRAAAHARRPDRAQPGQGPARGRHRSSTTASSSSAPTTTPSTAPRTATSSARRWSGAGLRVPRSAIATTLEEAEAARDDIGLPVIVRPAFTLGGRGGGVARTAEEFDPDRLAAAWPPRRSRRS